MASSPTNRRQLFRGAGLTVGTLAGLGLDLEPAKAAALAMKSKLKGAREFATILQRPIRSTRRPAEDRPDASAPALRLSDPPKASRPVSP